MAFLVEDIDGVSCLVSDDVVGNKSKGLYIFWFSYVFVLLLLRLFFPGVSCLFYSAENLSRDVDHDGTLWLCWPKNSVIFLVVRELMEENICFFKHRLPSKDQIVEIVHSNSKISLEDIFFEGIWFSKVDSIEYHL